MTGRAIAEAVKTHLPQPIAVVNRAGGSGTIGTSEVVTAKPDGYTIGITAVAVLTMQPHLNDLPYKGPEDMIPVISLINQAIVFAVRDDSPYKTMQDFLDAAKAKPGQLKVGHPGNGTVLHIDLERLKVATNTDIVSVPFAGGGESVPAFLGGHVDALVAHPAEIIAHVKAGKARVLGVFEDERIPGWEDVPTFKEMGIDVVGGVYYMIIVPKDTPADVVKTLHDAIQKAQKEQSFVDFAKDKYDIFYSTGDELMNKLKADYVANGKIVEQLGMKKQ